MQSNCAFSRHGEDAPVAGLGLGTFRVAAAAATVRQGISPTLDYLRQPIRTDVRFVVQPVAPPAVVLVHGLAPGGVHTAILIGRLHDTSNAVE